MIKLIKTLTIRISVGAALAITILALGAFSPPPAANVLTPYAEFDVTALDEDTECFESEYYPACLQTYYHWYMDATASVGDDFFWAYTGPEHCGLPTLPDPPYCSYFYNFSFDTGWVDGLTTPDFYTPLEQWGYPIWTLITRIGASESDPFYY